jgi:hypothetical protein
MLKIMLPNGPHHSGNIALNTPTMLRLAEDNFAFDPDRSINVIEHDLNAGLLALMMAIKP